MGVRLGDGVLRARLRDVTVESPSDTGVYVGCALAFVVFMRSHSACHDRRCAPHSLHSDATMERVTVKHGKRCAFWLNGSGKCRLLACRALFAGAIGFSCDALQRCIFERCVASGCGAPGAVFDLPVTLMEFMEKRGQTLSTDALLHEAHSAQARVCATAAAAARTYSRMLCGPSRAQHCKFEGNREYGVLVMRGVSVDLSYTRMIKNWWNGLRITFETLLNATARITLTGASATGNGVGKDADDAQMDRVGVVIEETAAGASRLAALSPADARGAMTLADNRGGDWAVWRMPRRRVGREPS